MDPSTHELPFAVEASSSIHSNSTTTSTNTSTTASFSASTGRIQSTVTSMLSRITGHRPGTMDQNTHPVVVDMGFTCIPEWEEDDSNKNVIVPAQESADILTLLLSGALDRRGGENALELLEAAHNQAIQAVDAKREGNLEESLDFHTAAAKSFHKAALLAKEDDAIMFRSLELLSQSQAKYALALKRSLKLRPNNMVQQQERIRATVRGALWNNRVLEESVLMDTSPEIASSQEVNIVVSEPDQDKNPVDEIMELERELRQMDAAMDMHQSIASVDSRQSFKMKQDGSFMMVGGNASVSNLSNSAMWGHVSSVPPTGRPVKPNLVHNKSSQKISTSSLPLASPPRTTTLDASWWGTPVAASQILSSSVISMSTNQSTQDDSSTSTKQILRLMDTIKALSDENAVLLRQVEKNESARREARAAREQMRRFQDEYKERFATLQNALEKFRQQESEKNPVATSNYIQSAAVQEQLHRQEQMIRKLTHDLQKEKEENRRKDSALRKYETFYREVKARSAQKAAQRQREAASGTR